MLHTVGSSHRSGGGVSILKQPRIARYGVRIVIRQFEAFGNGCSGEYTNGTVVSKYLLALLQKLYPRNVGMPMTLTRLRTSSSALMY